MRAGARIHPELLATKAAARIASISLNHSNHEFYGNLRAGDAAKVSLQGVETGGVQCNESYSKRRISGQSLIPLLFGA